MKNVLEYLESSVIKFPQKTAFTNADKSVSFEEIFEKSRRIGTCLQQSFCTKNRPVVVVTEQDPDDITAMLGVVYSGNFYVPVDAGCPSERLKTMVESISPVAVLAKHIEKYDRIFDSQIQLLSFEDAMSGSINEDVLKTIRNNMNENDPLFAIFTSGSTGIPKCVVKSHRGMISFIETYASMFDFDETTIFGNQSPLYFDASTKDVYTTLKCAAQTVFIPKSYFMFPSQAIKMLNEYKVDTIVWVPSVMCTVSVFNVFEEIKPDFLKKVFFVGEVMPVKHLNYWMEHLPDVKYTNLYGTTEAAGNCLYYEITGHPEPDKPLPLGVPFPNNKVFLLNTENEPDAYGEICISGPTVALSYYNIPDMPQRFCQNPANTSYYERICRTGDFARVREDGLFEFVSRADFQIKHMGNRIELGDIEAAALAIDGVDACCCVYNKAKDMIVLFFVSKVIDTKILKKSLKSKLPAYMLPSKTIQLSDLPRNANGKTDRKNLLDTIS